MWSANQGKAYRLVNFCIVIFALCFSAAVRAEEASEPGFLDSTKERLGNIVHDEDWDLYVSGFSYHVRSTYSSDRVKKLNEKAWGLGVGKTFRNAKGNDESLYLMVIKDSHYNAQWMAGYAHQWIYPMTDSNIELGAGITGLFIRRKDWFDGNPFPALLPFASVGTQGAKLYATYVPRISTRKGKGDVLLFFAKFEF